MFEDFTTVTMPVIVSCLKAICNIERVGFVMDKEALGQVFSEYFGSPCQSFHRFLHYHNHTGLTQ
jgi:hypothetical protein